MTASRVRRGKKTVAAEASSTKNAPGPLPCAAALNWGWDTSAIFGHVDPHPRVESACAGSYG